MPCYSFSVDRAWAQQKNNSSQCSTAYENHNQTDYGPLKVRLVGGRSIVQVGTSRAARVPLGHASLFSLRKTTSWLRPPRPTLRGASNLEALHRVYLSNSGAGVESTDQNSSSGECEMFCWYEALVVSVLSVCGPCSSGT